MKGGVYSDQRCPLCGSRFKHVEPKGLFCPDHPECQPTRFKVKFGNVTKRFRSYDVAHRFLTGLRFKTDEGSFDERDYRKDEPLGFANLAKSYLRFVKQDVKCYRNPRRHIELAVDAWGNRNIKEIGYGEIEDLLRSDALSHLSGKTRANVRATLHAFWVWLRKRKVLRLDQMPEFPEVHYKLGWRKTIDKETQQAVLDEIKRISWAVNPKIWIGCRWLCTYISIRPIEMIHIQEKDFRYDLGVVEVWYSKTDEPRFVPFLPEDLELAKSFGPAIRQDLYFFRHVKGNSLAHPGSRFGPKYLYKWWKKACLNLGIEGVDLYGGTRHSSTRALREFRTPEEIKRATMHATNKAFERYFKVELDDTRSVYVDTVLTPKKGKAKKGKVLKFKD